MRFEDVELLTAPTAEMGIELARARRPDVIIMDINLPGMSGIDALRALRAAPETKDIPVIALTAAASERDRQRGIQSGLLPLPDEAGEGGRVRDGARSGARSDEVRSIRHQAP